jgi:type III secretory pathway component EscS
MAIDAVFPAASELVMVYGGALASGALVAEIDVLGHPTTGFWAFVAVVLALFATATVLGGTLYNFSDRLFSNFPTLIH